MSLFKRRAVVWAALSAFAMPATSADFRMRFGNTYSLVTAQKAATLPDRHGQLDMELKDGAMMNLQGQRIASVRIASVTPGGAAAQWSRQLQPKEGPDGQAFKPGDVIFALDGFVFTSGADLRRYVSFRNPGQWVKVEYESGGATSVALAVIGPASELRSKPARPHTRKRAHLNAGEL